MKRPLLIVALSFIIGIIIGVYLEKSILYINIVLIIGLILVVAKLFRKPYLITVITILITIILSLNYTVLTNRKYMQINENLEDKQITAEAIVCGEVKETDYTYTVNVKVLQVNGNTKYKNITLILMIKKNNAKLEDLKYGNKIKITGTFDGKSDSRNYGGFSYREYLKTKKIYGGINAENVLVIAQNKENIINTGIYFLTQSIKNNIDKLLPQETAGLLKGILIGDCSDITEDIKSAFKDCNLTHMLAVSGAHLTYLIIGINIVFNKKIVGVKQNKIISIVVIIIFMLVTGMSPSVVRAGICTILYIVASLMYRKSDAYTTLAIALLYTFIDNPFSLFNVGMQLSYAGTISLMVFYPKIREYVENKEKNLTKKSNAAKLKEKPSLTHLKNSIELEEKTLLIYMKKTISKYLKIIVNSLKESELITITANILIMPITMYSFNTISLNFVISNVLTSSLLGWGTVLGLFTVLLSFISMPLAKILAIPLNLIIELLIKITSIISKIPYSNITIITPYLITIIFIYIVIVLLYIAKNVNKNKEKNNIIRKVLILALVIYIFLIFAISVITKIQVNKKLTIHFVDVGQGDCSFIQTPTGKNILIDGGGSREAEKYDVGEQVLLPYLLDRRVNKIDYIIISHFDADHCQGLEAVLKTIKVKNVIVCKQASDSQLYQEIMQICKNKKINVMVVKRGQKLTIDKYVYFEILHPGDKMLDDGKGGLNANAIVAKLYFKSKKEFTMLFTGDIEEDAEKELVKIYGKKLKCDILKVPHHGSKTSSTAEFLQCASPKIALIGVGENNTFGHPNEGVLQRLENLNVKVYRTDKMGEITIEVYKNSGKSNITLKNKT